MKIYTGNGDLGFTDIVGASHISKDDPRIEAYGSVDELNSHIGLLESFCNSDYDKNNLYNVQRMLFSVGGYLATEEKTQIKTTFDEKGSEFVKIIEHEIDVLSCQLPKSTRFVLPCGTKSASQAHICRTVCRRVERNIVHFVHTIDYSIDPSVLIFINRLSDYFFLLAIKFNQDEGVIEIIK